MDQPEGSAGAPNASAGSRVSPANDIDMDEEREKIRQELHLEFEEQLKMATANENNNISEATKGTAHV